MKLTQEKLKKFLDYNFETGIFTWKVRRKNSVNVGAVAGSLSHGYILIMISGKFYRAHRLAWLYIHGYFPEYFIDHIDRDRSNNRINNLRHVSNQCNVRNSGNRKDNKSGIKGIGWHKATNKWRVRIAVNNKSFELGIFTSFDEAICHRLAAEQCVDWAGCDSATSAYTYVKNNIQQETTNE